MIRVRFAPSPTGHLHIGGVRTALFNYLFARANGGKYLLRVEDTDKLRSTPEFQKSQIESLAWLGLLPDEEIYIQSAAQDLHCAYIAQLIKEEKAYHQEGAVYFKIQAGATLTFTDGIRGDLTIPSEYLSDFVIQRSDGTPIYNFAVVVDDHIMKITHVIRGEDHIANTYKQILLYQALGWNPPVFAHLPLIVNSNGAPLSKRDGVTDVFRYREMGVLPAALLNYLVRLGWACGDQELFTREELCALFSLSGVGKKPAVFDAEKLAWVSSQYIQAMPIPQLAHLLLTEPYKTPEDRPDLPPVSRELFSTYAPESDTHEFFLHAIGLYKTRSATLVELAAGVLRILNRPLLHDTFSFHADNRSEQAQTHRILTEFLTLIQTSEWETSALTMGLNTAVKTSGLQFKTWGHAIRSALTGQAAGPGTYDILIVLGRDESCARIERALEHLA